MSANSEKSKDKVEEAVVAEKAVTNDANKEDEKADLVSHNERFDLLQIPNKI